MKIHEYKGATLPPALTLPQLNAIAARCNVTPDELIVLAISAACAHSRGVTKMFVKTGKFNDAEIIAIINLIQLSHMFLSTQYPNVELAKIIEKANASEVSGTEALIDVVVEIAGTNVEPLSSIMKR